MSDNASQPTEDALWWLSFERPQYPQAISSADIRLGLRFRFYHSRWSRHHTGLRLFDSYAMTVQSEIVSDHSAPEFPYIHAPRSRVECYHHGTYSRVNYALSALGLEPHRTQWGPMWDLSAFCTSIDAPQMRWDEPRPNHEGMLGIGDLRGWIHFHSDAGSRLMKVMSEVEYCSPREANSAYGGLVVTLHDSSFQKTSAWRLEDLGILPYVNPNGERWGDNYCTSASAG